MIGTLRTFGTERLIFWRESASGTSVAAHFLAKMFVDSIPIVIKPIVFGIVYYPLTRSNIANSLPYFFTVLIMVSFMASAYGYVISLIFNPKNSSMAAFTMAIILGAFLSGAQSPKLKVSRPTIYCGLQVQQLTLIHTVTNCCLPLSALGS